jgi:hypothetical protein
MAVDMEADEKAAEEKKEQNRKEGHEGPQGSISTLHARVRH